MSAIQFCFVTAVLGGSTQATNASFPCDMYNDGHQTSKLIFKRDKPDSSLTQRDLVQTSEITMKSEDACSTDRRSKEKIVHELNIANKQDAFYCTSKLFLENWFARAIDTDKQRWLSIDTSASRIAVEPRAICFVRWHITGHEIPHLFVRHPWPTRS